MQLEIQRNREKGEGSDIGLTNSHTCVVLVQGEGEKGWETHVGEGEHVQSTSLKFWSSACTCPASPARATHPL